MVRKEAIELVDDMGGRPIDDDGQTIQFAYRGVDYEIDLQEKNAAKFDKLIGYGTKHAMAQKRAVLAPFSSAIGTFQDGARAPRTSTTKAKVRVITAPATMTRY